MSKPIQFFTFAEREGFFLRCAAKATKVDCEPIGVLAACLSVKTKKNTARVLFLVFAEREGFEPPVPCGTPVFKTGVIDHSTISPDGLAVAVKCGCKFSHKF